MVSDLKESEISWGGGIYGDVMTNYVIPNSEFKQDIWISFMIYRYFMMTLTMISKRWYFFHDEWMRRGEDYLRKIVGGWHWRKLRISPEFIWDHERRYHHQNLCHHLHHHRCHSLTVKCTFICCAVTPSLSYCHLCHHYSPQNNCIFYCHYNLSKSHFSS